MKSSRSDKERTLPGLTQTPTYKTALQQIAHVLRQNLPSFPGARVEGAGTDPKEPEYYVVTLRIPGQERGENRQPMTLFHLLSPDWFSRQPVGELVYVAAIGYAAASISVRRFLRTWQDGRIGGEVIYEGDLTDPALGERALEGLQRFLTYRDDITVKNGIGTISVWPLTTDFRPRLCEICLLPAAQGVCPKCGMATVPGHSKRRWMS